jgi:hypothetical protein
MRQVSQLRVPAASADQLLEMETALRHRAPFADAVLDASGDLHRFSEAMLPS